MSDYGFSGAFDDGGRDIAGRSCPAIPTLRSVLDDINVANFKRCYGHIPEVDDLEPKSVPVRRWVSGWSVVAGEQP